MIRVILSQHDALALWETGWGVPARPRRHWCQFRFHLRVSNETESFASAGKNSLAFQGRFPGLDIVVGDLLFPRADGFDSEFVEHAEHLCVYAIGHARKRAQAMGGER
jgi:hypothetical protein